MTQGVRGSHKGTPEAVSGYIIIYYEYVRLLCLFQYFYQKNINSMLFAAENKNIYEFISNPENFGNSEILFFSGLLSVSRKWTLYLDFAGHNTQFKKKTFLESLDIYIYIYIYMLRKFHDILD